jgi:S1-C subfamily serine protease
MLGYASGFFVNSDGYVVTSQHVIEGAVRSYAIYRENENIAIDAVVANDPARDIAVLKARVVDTPSLKLGNSDNVEIGNEIYTIGAPWGLLNTVSKGIISQIRYSKGVKYIQLDAPISPGNSGGPLLDRNLEVIGINFAYFREGQNLNFAIPSNYIKALLRKAKVNYK